MEKNLTLTGMMAVGKTTIGKRLAKKLKYNFADIDKIIEKRRVTLLVQFSKIKGKAISEK